MQPAMSWHDAAHLFGAPRLQLLTSSCPKVCRLQCVGIVNISVPPESSPQHRVPSPPNQTAKKTSDAHHGKLRVVANAAFFGSQEFSSRTSQPGALMPSNPYFSLIKRTKKTRKKRDQQRNKQTWLKHLVHKKMSTNDWFVRVSTRPCWYLRGRKAGIYVESTDGCARGRIVTTPSGGF